MTRLGVEREGVPGYRVLVMSPPPGAFRRLWRWLRRKLTGRDERLNGIYTVTSVGGDDD